MTTEAKWAARVAAWRASGRTATEFCAGKDFKAGGLRYWASRLRRDDAAPGRELRLAKVVTPGSLGPETPVVLEVGGVQVALRSGFDREVLREVIELLTRRAS